MKSVTIASRTLVNTTGTSNKVYTIRIESVGSQFQIKADYGRIGSDLQTETKTAPSVAERAQKIANALLSSKLSGGYREVNQREYASLVKSAVAAKNSASVTVKAPKAALTTQSAIAA